MWRHSVYPLVGLPIKHVLGITHSRESQKYERSSFIISQSRDGIWREGLSPFPSHDYPEYETPSKRYENGSITYFGGNYRRSKAIPQY